MHQSEGRQRLQVLFIDEGEFVLVHRVLTKPEAERIEDAILGGEGVLDLGDFQRQQFFVDDGHPRLALSACVPRMRRSTKRSEVVRR